MRGLAGGGTNNNNSMPTPHRQRHIPTPVNTHNVNNQQQYGRDENFFSYQNLNGSAGLGMDRRQPLGGLNENSLGMGARFGGHVGGLSAGARIGRPQGSGGGANGVGVMGGGGTVGIGIGARGGGGGKH